MIERRVVDLQDCEIRTDADGDGRTFVGYAAVFNTPAKIGSFRESINPAAFNRALSSGQDIRMLFNHDSNQILGRTGKNVDLSVDGRGLRVEARLPNTTLGNDMAELVRSGIVSQMSFGFSVPQGGDNWSKGEDGMAERSLNDVDLYDVSPVVFPAYSETTAEVRACAERIVGDEMTVNEMRVLMGLPRLDNDSGEIEFRISQAERDQAAKDGTAMPDGSFPIRNEAELKAAIHLNGHSKTYTQTQIRNHIKARAKALGLTSLIPDSWSEGNSGDEADEKRAGKVISADNMAKLDAARQHIQDVMDAASNPNELDGTEDTDPAWSYNSAHRERIIRIAEASLPL